MVLPEEECTCTEATNSSNITSLATDDVSSVVDTSQLNGSVTQTGNNKPNNKSESKKNGEDYKTVDGNSQTNPGATDYETNFHVCRRGDALPSEYPKRQSLIRFNENEVPCFYHTHRVSAYTLPVKTTTESRKSYPFWSRLNPKWAGRKSFPEKEEIYGTKDEQYPYYAKPYVCCAEETETIPNGYKPNGYKQNEYKHHKVENKLSPTKVPMKKKDKTRIAERIDIYYFDHGNSAYYQTTDSPPILATDKCAEKTNQAAIRFWAEIFGTIHIGAAFVTAFILQLFRFLLFSIIRPLTVGLLQLFADYFIKPCLSIMFNSLIQPVLILLYNIATSFKDLCEPISEAFGLFLREIANLCASIRIIEVKQTPSPPTSCT